MCWAEDAHKHYISRAQYGSPSDFDEWAQITGDDSWSWKEFGSYFRKFENYTYDPRYPDVDLSQRGSKGPMQVGRFNHTSKLSDDFLKACQKVGISYISDFNTALGTKGVSRVSVLPNRTIKSIFIVLHRSVCFNLSSQLWIITEFLKSNSDIC